MWWIISIGCLLGAVQLTAGVFIGLWLRRGDGADAAGRGQQELLDADRIAQRLQALAGEVSTTVGEHQQRIQAASQLLASEADEHKESITELVVDVIGGIVRANQTLQNKLETAEHRLQEQAAEIQAHISRSLTDPLTGLPNRREFNERLEERMAGWRRRGDVFSLLLLDVDHFKQLNDRHGHLAGDMMLTMLGRTLRSVLRRDDSVARFGGEEFAMILPGTTLQQAIGAVPKVQEAAARAVVTHGSESLRITLSGGLATIQRGETNESLIARADSALYAAKAAGRNCVFLHDGMTCRAAMDVARMKSDPAAESMSELLSLAAGAAKRTECGDRRGEEVSRYPANKEEERISPQLAQACQELRQYVSEQAAAPRAESVTA
jgi:diguanylate cyclase